MIVKQLAIFVENKPGRLAAISKVISGAGVNMRALSIADTTDFGILRLLTDDPEKDAVKLKESKLTVSVTEVLSVCIDDIPGGLAAALDVIAGEGISVEYIYAFASSYTRGKAMAVISTDDCPKAQKALESAGFADHE